MEKPDKLSRIEDEFPPEEEIKGAGITLKYALMAVTGLVGAAAAVGVEEIIRRKFREARQEVDELVEEQNKENNNE